MAEVLPYNAADPEHVKARKGTARRFEEMRRSGLRSLAASPEGRALIWWLLERCGFARISFDPNSHRMAFNEGERNVALAFIAEMSAAGCAGAYLAAQQEAERGYAAEGDQVKAMKEAANG